MCNGLFILYCIIYNFVVKRCPYYNRKFASSSYSAICNLTFVYLMATCLLTLNFVIGRL